ncbi:Protein phosphatase [Trema orientale]|uniref:Protein phosphatase n=1 Tax=Trema orientale TaxID=63057 RepID=A0A2P5E8R4_TREOI|nr:Protein phosphatase [Trema orientale]
MSTRVVKVIGGWPSNSSRNGMSHQGSVKYGFSFVKGKAIHSIEDYLEKFWTDPSSPDLGRGGSTTITAILINNQKLRIANVEDSRAVLSRRGQAAQMNIDQNPTLKWKHWEPR